MTPFDPTQPQPGDWEAALATIEAAEVRHDAVRRLRRMGWAVMAVGAIGGSLWWFAPTGGELKQGIAIHAEDETATSSVVQEATPWPPASDAVDDLDNGPAGTSEIHLQPVSSSATSIAPTQPVTSPRPSAIALTEPVQDRPPVRGDLSLVASALNAPDEQRRAFETEYALPPLHPLNAVILEGSWVRPLYQAVQSEEVKPQPEQPWGVLLGWEPGAWTLFAARELRPAWFLRVGGVWDVRHRTWVAEAGRDVFGAPQAPRSVLSNQAVWASLGMERRQHIKGRWGAVARLDGQCLMARHLVEGQWGQGEQIIAGNAEAWGNLKEESSLRLGWGVGVDWAAAESHDVRLTVGGHWSPTAEFDYIQWTEGQPAAMGEFRLTWIWK